MIRNEALERKTGKWKIQVGQPNTFSPGGNPVYACSECGWVYGVPLDIEPEYNYCPNCGTDMIGDEE